MMGGIPPMMHMDLMHGMEAHAMGPQLPAQGGHHQRGRPNVSQPHDPDLRMYCYSANAYTNTFLADDG